MLAATLLSLRAPASPGSLLLAAALATASTAVVSDAAAFCRTTTSKSPAGYDPAVDGCWYPQGAVPLAWPPSETVAYQLAAAATPQISLADATTIAAESFGAWNAATCAGGTPSVQTTAGPPADDATVLADCGLSGPNATCGPTEHDSHHLIVFQSDKSQFDDPTSTLGLTTVTYGVTSGTIYDADMEINATVALTTQDSVSTPPPYDLRVIMTHEAGHFLGLAHATDTHSIMYYRYQSGALKLTQDDIDGVCTVYPPTHDSGCSCAVVGGEGEPRRAPALLALLLAGGLPLLARRRLRPRSGSIDNHP
jgi:MYXO-CTERM domain-containing protein